MKRSAGFGLVLMVSIAIGTHAPCAASQERAILDLTKKPSADVFPSSGSRGGFLGGVIGGGERTIFLGPQKHTLPLEATIQALKPARDTEQQNEQEKETFVIELVLRNLGDAPFFLPVSRNYVQAWKLGNADRRSVLFRVRFLLNGETQAESVGFAATFGSTSVPESLLRLEPQESILVLLPADLTPLARALAAGRKEAAIQGVCSEDILEDDRNFDKSMSEKIHSNVMRIELRDGKLTPIMQERK